MRTDQTYTWVFSSLTQKSKLLGKFHSLGNCGSGARICEIAPLDFSQDLLCKRNIPIVALASTTYFNLQKKQSLRNGPCMMRTGIDIHWSVLHFECQPQAPIWQVILGIYGKLCSAHIWKHMIEYLSFDRVDVKGLGPETTSVFHSHKHRHNQHI